MTLNDILKYLQKEWATIRNAPLSFLVIMLACFSISFYVVNYLKQQEITNLNTQIETLKEREKTQSVIITEYRQRLHLTERKASKYEQLSNAELISETEQLVEKIREIIHWKQKKIDELRYYHKKQELEDLQDEEKKKNINQKYNQLEHNIFLEMMFEYNNKIKVEAVLLSEEYFSRLPREYKGDLGILKTMYEYPTNQFGLEKVISHLESLSKMLS